MKRYLLVLLTTLFMFSCNLDDGAIETRYVVLPIESIQLPSEFVLNEEYDIDFTFIRPSDCHVYQNIYFIAENETRTLAVKNIVYINPSCMDITEDNVVSESFKFKALYNQTYVFRVWMGVDDLGEEIYDVIEVPVVN